MCGGPDGSLMKLGKASWWCDTEYVWKKGVETSNEELVAKIVKEGQEQGTDVLGGLVDGSIHFIWTGGEPTMEHNREAITYFLRFWQHTYPHNQSFHELETNGTIECDLYDHMDQINCSAKLANSGMTTKARIVPAALKQIADHPNHWWKFVINYEQDIQEIEETYLKPHNLKKNKVILMPGVDNLATLPAVTKFLYETCKKYGYRGVTRGHILAWDKTTGV